MFADIMKVFML